MNKVINQNIDKSLSNYQLNTTEEESKETSIKDTSTYTNILKKKLSDENLNNNNFKTEIPKNENPIDILSSPKTEKSHSLNIEEMKKTLEKINQEKKEKKENIEKKTIQPEKEKVLTLSQDLKSSINATLEADHLKYLKQYYSNYLKILDNNTDPKLLKRSFDQYMEIVDEKYVQSMNVKTCKTLNGKYFKNFGNVDLDKSHKPIFLDDLGSAYYTFFKIIDFVWKQKKVLKKWLKNLSPCKIFILRCLVIRKFGQEIDFRNVKKMKEHLNSLKLQKSSKRNEENLKFLLKKVFKFLQSFKFAESENIDQDIYNEYFKENMSFEFFEKNFISICRTKKIIHLKKINNKIITSIFKSEKFVNILKLYCEDFLVKEYQYEISWKIFILVKKWKKQMNDDKMNQDVFKDICDHIETNKQFKLPWTLAEVESSVEFLYQYIKNSKNENLKNF